MSCFGFAACEKATTKNESMWCNPTLYEELYYLQKQNYSSGPQLGNSLICKAQSFYNNDMHTCAYHPQHFFCLQFCFRCCIWSNLRLWCEVLGFWLYFTRIAWSYFFTQSLNMNFWIKIEMFIFNVGKQGIHTYVSNGKS